MGSVPSYEIGNTLSGTVIFTVQSKFDYKWPVIAKSLRPDLLTIIEG